MQNIEIKENIVDRFGRVLIKKGYIIPLTPNNIEKFKKLEILDQILEQNHRGSEQHQVEADAINNFKKRYATIDTNKLEKASTMVQKVLEVSKIAEWSLHLKVMHNRYAWIYSHSVNTALIAAIISFNLGYSEDKINEVILGALLHDVGLVLLPQKLITKTEEFTRDEIALLEKHCEFGESMIQEAGFPSIARSIILQHHEKIDGSGFPSGLKGHEVSEESQIVMISDLIDMATSFSVYQISVGGDEKLKQVILERENYPVELVNSLIELYAKCIE